MDLNQHLGKIVEGLVSDITANVITQVDRIVAVTISNKLENYDFAEYIKQAASTAFEKKVSEYQIDSKRLEGRISEKIKLTIDQIQANASEKIEEEINSKIKNVNFQKAMSDAVSVIINDRMQEYIFPENSIHSNAINFTTLISGDNIHGGIIKEFSSTGIDDRSSSIALTILDEATVVENNLITKDLTVQGSMVINGNFIVNGNIPAESQFYQTLINDSGVSVINKLNTKFFSGYSDLVFDKIKTNGIDLTKITINGSSIIDENKLGSTITESNLQKLGLVKELQVSGETLLGETLYVNNKRTGINTIEPSAALAIWDDEIEIIVSKKQKDIGFFGTPRQQKLILSSNNKENLILDVDGSVKIDNLQIGSMKFSSSENPPNYVSQRGQIVWNASPNPGGPMGWICLGASNWANFGIID